MSLLSSELCSNKARTSYRREWIALSAFRVTRVEADAGYVEYKIIGQHRERWVSDDVAAALYIYPTELF